MFKINFEIGSKSTIFVEKNVINIREDIKKNIKFIATNWICVNFIFMINATKNKMFLLHKIKLKHKKEKYVISLWYKFLVL